MTSVAIPTRSSPARNATYIPFGAFGTMDPDINSPRVQQWNVTVEQQLGATGACRRRYLGSYSDRLWAQTALNPGVFMGLGPCTINTAAVAYPVCSTTANLNQRRVLSLAESEQVALRSARSTSTRTSAVRSITA